MWPVVPEGRILNGTIAECRRAAEAIEVGEDAWRAGTRYTLSSAVYRSALTAGEAFGPTTVDPQHRGPVPTQDVGDHALGKH